MICIGRLMGVQSCSAKKLLDSVALPQFRWDREYLFSSAPVMPGMVFVD